MCTKETRSSEQSSFFVQQNLSLGQVQSPEFYQAPTPSEKHIPSSVWAVIFQSLPSLYKAGGDNIEISPV